MVADMNPHKTTNPWPTLTADEIARRIRMGRARGLIRRERMAAIAERRRQLILSAQPHPQSAPPLLSSSDDEL